MKTHHTNVPRKVCKMTSDVHEQIKSFIGDYPAERGAMFGRDPDGIIRHCVLDTEANCNSVAYDPDINYLNRVIKSWTKQGIEFVGFVHSHPKGFDHPSMPDELYSASILQCFERLELLWIPIVQTIPTSGRYELIPYAAIPSKDRTKCTVVKAQLEIINEHQKPTINTPLIMKKTYGTLANVKPKSVPIESKYFQDIKLAKGHYDAYFQRQVAHFDLDLLNDTRLVVFGTGGAASFIKSCARMGFGEFILIDPDTISASNIATQDVSVSAIGQPKVEALAEQITAINPLATVVTIADTIESLSDSDLEELTSSPIKSAWTTERNLAIFTPVTPRKTILLVLTDNFEAQARGHRIGLNLGLPTICAQEYSEGVGAEITYTIPGVTPACHRCITSNRYSAYLNKGYKNDVTSAGAPIFAADFLNASLGHILLAVSHHESNNANWGDVANQLGNRNLVMLKMSPAFSAKLGMDVVAKNVAGAKDPAAFHMLNAVFLPQIPDSGQTESIPICPDCGGHGDLLRCVGTFDNTKTMRY